MPDAFDEVFGPAAPAKGKAPDAFDEVFGAAEEPKIEDVRGAIFGNAGTEDALPFSDNEKVDYVKRLFPGQDVDPGSEVLSPDEQQRIYAGYKREPYVVGASAGDPEFTRRTSVAAFDKLFGNRTRSEVEAAIKKFEGDPATKGEQAQYLAGRFVSGMNAPAMGYAAKLFGPGGVLENPASLEAAANVADPSRASLGSRHDRVRAAIESTTTGRIASGAAEFLGATPGLINAGRALAPLGAGAGPATLGLQGLAASGGDVAAAGEGVLFGALAGALSAPIKAVISRWPPALRSQAIDRLATMAGGGAEFAAADAILHGPDGERALMNFIFGAGMKSVGKTAGMDRVERQFEANKGVMPTETPFAPGVRRPASPEWVREGQFETAKDVMPTETPIAPRLPEAGRPLPVPEKPILEVPDAPNLKRGKSATKVMAEVQARAEAKAPVDEALRRFEERTGIKVAPESTPTEKPVSVAPKAPAEAPRATPKAEPARLTDITPPEAKTGNAPVESSARGPDSGLGLDVGPSDKPMSQSFKAWRSVFQETLSKTGDVNAAFKEAESRHPGDYRPAMTDSAARAMLAERNAKTDAMVDGMVEMARMSGDSKQVEFWEGQREVYREKNRQDVESKIRDQESDATLARDLRRFEATHGYLTQELPKAKAQMRDAVDNFGDALRAQPQRQGLPAPVDAPKPKPVEAAPPPVEAPRPEGVSIKNAAVEADRAARGAEPLPETKPEKMADWKDEAVRRVEENPNYPVELIERLKRTGSPHDKVEAAALTVHRVKLNESLAKAEADVLKAAERGDMDGVKEAKIRADNLRAQDYEVSELVGKAAGAEAARALGARAMALDNQYELLPMETRLRVENNGDPLSDAQRAETKAIHDEMAALRKKVADYEARKGGKIELLEGKRPDVPKVSVADVKGAEYGRRNTIVTREAYDATRAALRDKLSRMSANPFLDPSMIGDLAKIGAFHVEAGVRSFASWSKAMVSDLGDKVTPHLREIWRAAQIEMGEPGQGDAKRLAALKSRLRTRIADREARMAMGKMENAPKRDPVKRDAEAIRLEAERDMIERKWQRTLMAAAWKQKSMAQKAGALAISGTRNLSRALMTAWDFSAPLRQGAILTASHPIKAAKAMGAMFRAFRSPEHQAMIEAEMRLDPKYGEAKRAGLFLSEHSDSAVAKMEENLVSGWIEKIPGVGASQRAYTTFLNKLRFDVFKGGLENLSSAKEATPAEARAWANFINVATGRGGPQGSPKMDAAFNALNNAFFAPRLAYSRFQMLLGTPMWRGTAASRKMIAMEYARSMTGLAIVYGLSQLVGGKIEKDGKVRFGNSVLDPTAGLASASKLLQQTVPGMAKAVTGEKRENQGFGRGDEVTAIGRYLRGKLAPLPGSALNLMSGKDPVGKPSTLGSEAVNLTTPMSYRDIYLAMKEHGVPKGAALGVLALFGMGLQNYRKKGG